jgi:hypothetical protein
MRVLRRLVARRACGRLLHIDLFAFTLDRTTGQLGNFLPNTRYRDFVIRPDLIHSESQAFTRADSETGLRYQKHVAMGGSVMLLRAVGSMSARSTSWVQPLT